MPGTIHIHNDIPKYENSYGIEDNGLTAILNKDFCKYLNQFIKA